MCLRNTIQIQVTGKDQSSTGVAFTTKTLSALDACGAVPFPLLEFSGFRRVVLFHPSVIPPPLLSLSYFIAGASKTAGSSAGSNACGASNNVISPVCILSCPP